MSKLAKFRKDSARAREILLNKIARLTGAVDRDDHVLAFHTGRSGSTVLGDLLTQNSQIYWGGETLEQYIHTMKRKTSRPVTELFGTYSIDDAVSAIENKHTSRAGNKIFGVEIQDYQFTMYNSDMESLIERLRDIGFTRYILIDRRNQLRKVVSHLVAMSRKEHHVDRGATRDRPQISINPDDIYIGYQNKGLFAAVDGYVKFLEKLRHLLAGRPVLELCYEDDIELDPSRAYRKTCAFLGVEPEEVEVRFGKTTNFPLSEIVSNFADVERCFANTPYAWMTGDSSVVAKPRGDLGESGGGNHSQAPMSGAMPAPADIRSDLR